MFRAIKRVFIWLGLMAEKATETDAINEAVVERGIRDSKAKADKAHYANGQLAGQIARRHRALAGEPRRDDEKLNHRVAGHDGRRDGAIHATAPPVRGGWRGPDARHA